MQQIIITVGKNNKIKTDIKEMRIDLVCYALIQSFLRAAEHFNEIHPKDCNNCGSYKAVNQYVDALRKVDALSREKDTIDIASTTTRAKTDAGKTFMENN